MHIERFRNAIKPTPQMSRNFITISKGKRREFVLDMAISYKFVDDNRQRISYETFVTVAQTS
jgi:hypothetical protein